ncbi:MAG: trigger factor [Candidatus Peribacteraceae bacterium]|nr:trigger factor [Candidatus Peribacteraceae bacterium]
MPLPTISIERLRAGKVECTVVFAPEHVAPAEEQALKALSAKLKIPGFRPGMAPRELLLEKIDRKDLLEGTLRMLLPDVLKHLLTEQKITTIIPPKVDLKKPDPLTILISFVERPAVKVRGADKITVERKEPKVEDKDVDRVIAEVLKRHQKSTEAARAAGEGDRVTTDFWGTGEDGMEVEGTRIAGHQVIIGSHTLLPGFEEALVGLAAGEKKEFTLTFPQKYHATALQGKPVTFHVTVTKVEEVETPALTDDFAKEKLQSDSAAAFREQIRSSLLHEEEHHEHGRRERALLEKIHGATVVELAQELIEEEENDLLKNIQRQLDRQNATFEQWLKASGKKMEEVRNDLKKEAQHRLTIRFGLEQLITDRGITVSDDELHAEVEHLLAPLPKDERAQIAPAYAKGERAYEQLKWQKQVEKLLEQMLAA